MDYHAHAIHSWTFAGLVGAFLDLSLAYLLLCGSTLTFFASKFLSFFGLYLPCPCNHGLFNDPYGSKCFKRLFVDFPTGKISSVHMSVKSRFPFDSIWMKNDHQRSGRHQLNLKLVRDNNDCCDGGGFLEMEGEASCSSFSDARAPIRKKMSDVVALGLLSSGSAIRQSISSDVGGKGKTISSHHHRSSSSRSSGGGIRRRRRAAVDHGISSSVSSSDPPGLLLRKKVSVSPYSISQTGHEITEEYEETSMRMNSKMNDFQYVEEVPVGFNFPQGSRSGFQMTELRGEGGGDNMVKDAPSAGESVDSSHRELGLEANETHSVRMLEQALEEEHAARNALYLELEKERSAAASAADEAMAMILRLQEEKASIEMEARQYQRMIEEKSAYDAEEMNILKEILLRREREKHFLEKEVEAYRTSTCMGDEQLEGDSLYVGGMSGQRPNLFNSSEDPVFMLQEISESISKKEMMENMKDNFDYDTFSLNEQSCSPAFGEISPSPDWNADDDFLKQRDVQKSLNSERHHSHVPVHMDDCRHKLQEKGMVFMDERPSSSQHQGETLNADSGVLKSNETLGHQLHEKTIIFLDGEHKQKDNATLCEGAPKTDQTLSEVEISFPCDSTDLEKHGKNVNHQGDRDPKTSSFETEPSVYDVHVIDDESMRCNHKNVKERELVSGAAISDKPKKCFLPLEVSGSRRNHILSDSPSTSRVETEPDIHRSSSDMSTVTGMMDKSLGKAVNFDLQKNPIFTVDNERSKLETEVDWLRERLRIVQEGREKLSFSVEHREREQIQLQLLEDIASQLREIRQLTEPGKAVRQASLPPSSSKLTPTRAFAQPTTRAIGASSASAKSKFAAVLSGFAKEFGMSVPNISSMKRKQY